MKHHLQLTLDDISLDVDDKWPDSFLHSHGDTFDCDIEIDYIAEDGIEQTGTPYGISERAYVDIIKVSHINILVNEKRPELAILKRMRRAVKTSLERKPQILLKHAQKELNKY